MCARLLTLRVDIALLVFLTVALVGTVGVGAHGTPAVSGTSVAEGNRMVHPAHIDMVTCPDVGDVVYPLNDLTPAFGLDSLQEGGTPVASPAAASTMVHAASEVVAESTTTEVDASLDDNLGTEHAINVHESLENIQNYIACGDLTGTPTNGALHIELRELNDSGFVGEAHLLNNGDGSTMVRVSIF